MKRKAISFGLIIACIIVSTGFNSSCVHQGTFERPKDIVPYEEIISVYNVTIIGDIPEEEVQEIFTILKELPDDSLIKPITGDYWNVKLSGMEIERTENGITNIKMQDREGLHGWQTRLEVKRNWLGSWVLTEHTFALLDYID
jgi:hypothetical protein